jgi:uncharacterized membrane protein
MNVFGARTASPVEIGGRFSVTRTIVMPRPAAEVYRFWRSPQNARGVVPENVEVFRLSERRSHWVARLPGGRRLQCTLEQTVDEPDRRLAWRSVGESDVEFEADLRLAPASRADHTEVKLTVRWSPPPGWAGALLAQAARARAGRMVENVLEHARSAVEAAE